MRNPHAAYVESRRCRNKDFFVPAFVNLEAVPISQDHKGAGWIRTNHVSLRIRKESTQNKISNTVRLLLEAVGLRKFYYQQSELANCFQLSQLSSLVVDRRGLSFVRKCSENVLVVIVKRGLSFTRKCIETFQNSPVLIPSRCLTNYLVNQEVW